jgi:O-antigen ligase
MIKEDEMLAISWKRNIKHVPGILAVLCAAISMWNTSQQSSITYIWIGLMLVGLIMAAIVAPVWVIIFSLLVATLTGGPLLPDVTGSSLHIHGFFTGAILVAALVALVAHRRLMERKWFLTLLPFFLFAGWVWLRVLGSPVRLRGASDAIIILTPILICCVTLLVLKGLALEKLEDIFFLISWIPVAFILVGFAFGFVYFDEFGFYSPLGLRSLSLYLVVILSYSLMRVTRVDGSGKRAWTIAAILLSLLILAIIYLSLSRMAALIAFGIVLPVALIRPRRIISWLMSAAFGILVFGLVFFSPSFRQRSFSGEPAGEIITNPAGEIIISSGRFNVWPRLFLETQQHFWLGSGTGMAHIRAGEITSEISHGTTIWDNPHNDYLRVLFDQGVIGLILFLAAWISLAYYLLRAWQRETPGALHSNLPLAALLAVSVCVISFMTDNTLVYAFVMNPVFVLVGMALAVSYEVPGQPPILPDPVESGTPKP